MVDHLLAGAWVAARRRRSVLGRAGGLPHRGGDRRRRGALPRVPAAAAAPLWSGRDTEPSTRARRGDGADAGRARCARPVRHSAHHRASHGGAGAGRPQLEDGPPSGGRCGTSLASPRRGSGGADCDVITSHSSPEDVVEPFRATQPWARTPSRWKGFTRGDRWVQRGRMDLEDFRRTSYEIAEAIAPGWERRRGHIEEVAAPVREWMIRELGPRPGDRWRAYRRRTSLCLHTPSMAFALMTRALCSWASAPRACATSSSRPIRDRGPPGRCRRPQRHATGHIGLWESVLAGYRTYVTCGIGGAELPVGAGSRSAPDGRRVVRGPATAPREDEQR